LQPSLSIVLPCFNPPSGWEQLVVQEFLWLQETLPHEMLELLIINDGSESQKVNAKDFILEHIPNLIWIERDYNKGKGYSLREGVAKASAALIIFTDIDFPYERNSFLNIYESLKQHDIAIGIRSLSYYNNMPKARVYTSKILRWMIRTFLQIPTDDTQCGLKGFNQKGKEVFLTTTIDRYLFDLEFIFLAARKKLTLAKVEVHLREGVVLTKFNLGFIINEFSNFLKIVALSYWKR
jgi:glycosyltransferase involved in cell wall biosynthesis